MVEALDDSVDERENSQGVMALCCRGSYLSRTLHKVLHRPAPNTAAPVGGLQQ